MTVESITWLRLLRLVIGLKDSRQFFSQWESKPKPIAPRTRDFSRGSCELQVIARDCDWFRALLFLFWLVGVIALVLVFRQSFENRSNSYRAFTVLRVSRPHVVLQLECKFMFIGRSWHYSFSFVSGRTLHAAYSSLLSWLSPPLTLCRFRTFFVAMTETTIITASEATNRITNASNLLCYFFLL